MRSRVRRSIVLVLACGLLVGNGPCGGPGKLAPRIGILAHEVSYLVDVANGVSVNLVGGNVAVRRTDFSLDTRLGTWSLGATYHSASGSWHHSWDMTYDGSVFVDDTGAVLGIGVLPDGARVPGTRWVRIDASRVKTLGGVVFEFDASGRFASAYWGDDTYPRLSVARDASGRIETIDQCSSVAQCGALFTMTWGPDGIAAIDDLAGRRAEFTYANGRLSVAKDPLDVARGWNGFRYDYLDGVLSSVRNSEGEEVRIETDTAGRAVAITRIGEGDPHWAFSYSGADASGLYGTVSTDPEGHATTYRYDGTRRLVERVWPTGETATTTWASFPTPFHRASSTDTAGIVTTFSYPDADTELRSLPSGNVVRVEFAPIPGNHQNRANPNARPRVLTEDSMGVIGVATWSPEGRLASLENGAGERTDYGYYANGSLYSITPPAGPATTFSGYGAHGHATQVTTGGRTNVRSYDAVGNLTESSELGLPDAPGRPGVSRREFDEDRNLRSLSTRNLDLTSGPTTELDFVVDYRSDGQMTSVSRPHGGDHLFGYDALGRLVQVQERVDGVLETQTRSYDANDLLVSVTDARGSVRQVDFDPSRRPTRIRTDLGADFEEVTYQYSNGRLVSRLDSAYGVSETFSYDSAGRLQLVTFPGGESVFSAFDLRSRETARVYQMITPGIIAVLSMGYDAAGRQDSLSTGGNLVRSRVFTDGRLTSETYGNGLTRTFGYDDVLTGPSDDVVTGRLNATNTRNALQQNVETTAITRQGSWPSLWHVQSLSDVWHGNSLQSRDELYVLLAPFQGGGGLYLGWDVQDEDTQFYEYDHVGNSLPLDAVPTVLNAERNRYLSGPGGTYVNDAGYVTQRSGVSITWTPSGRIASHGSDQFEWDGSGRPRTFTIGGTTTQYRFGGAVETTAGGALVALDLGFVRLALGSTPTDLYRHRDLRGNVKFVTDGTGTVVAEYQYDGYGVEATIGGGDDRTFAGGRDLGDGLTLLGARVYDQATRRFLSPDPVFQLRSQHAYTGNPVQLSDPGGAQAMTVDPFSGGNGDPSGVLYGPAIAGGLIDRTDFGTGLIAAGGNLSTIGGLLDDSPNPHVRTAGKALGYAGKGATIIGYMLGGEDPSGGDAGPHGSGGGDSGGGGSDGGGSSGGGRGGGGGDSFGPEACCSALDRFTARGIDPMNRQFTANEWASLSSIEIGAIGVGIYLSGL